MRTHAPPSSSPSLVITLALALLIPISALTSCAPEGAGEEPSTATGPRESAVEGKADLPLGTSESSSQRQEHEMLREDLISLYQDFVDEELAIDAESAAWDFSGCLVCGRETGFLPTPTLTLDGVYALEGKDTSYVSLSWEPVEGATEYRVLVVQVMDGALVDVIDVDVNTTTFGVGLELGFDYFVYVVASNSDTKRRSEPSSPLLLSCAEGECALLDSSSIAVP